MLQEEWRDAEDKQNLVENDVFFETPTCRKVNFNDSGKQGEGSPDIESGVPFLPQDR